LDETGNRFVVGVGSLGWEWARFVPDSSTAKRGKQYGRGQEDQQRIDPWAVSEFH
jgi:hypothetical protein